MSSFRVSCKRALRPVWNLKPLWNAVPFTWQFIWRFHCGNFLNNSRTLLHMCKWYFNLCKFNQCKTDVALLVAFWTIAAKHMRTSLQLKWFCTILFHCGHLLITWKTHCGWKFHFCQVDRSEILHWSEISNWFQFTSGLM